MIKAITYLLAVICVVLSIMWFTDRSGSRSSETVREGESLKLLYELSDAELAALTSQEQTTQAVSEEPVVNNTAAPEERVIVELSLIHI